MSKKYYTVMLIDDNAIDNMIHTRILENSGVTEVIFNHHSAPSAIECLKNLVKIPIEGNRLLPAYIFLDLDMPLMNGFQFMAEFDKLDKTIKDGVKIVLLTASQNSSDQVHASKFANFHKYLNKPLSIQKIKDL